MGSKILNDEASLGCCEDREAGPLLDKYKGYLQNTEVVDNLLEYLEIQRPRFKLSGPEMVSVKSTPLCCYTKKAITDNI